MKPHLTLSLSLIAACLWLTPASAQRVETIDLERTGPYTVLLQDREWRDRARQRDVPVRIFAPRAVPGTAALATSRPLIVFSHGLGGSREGYDYFGRHLASHGFFVILPTHKGSDTDVLREDGALALVLAGMNPQNRIDRPKDVSFVIDRVLALKGDPLLGTIDPDKIGVAGHSFGAYTALAAVGQTTRIPGSGVQSFTDSRIRCSLPMSSQGTGVLGLSASSWDGIKVPVFTMTGTLDTGLGTKDVADRRVAFDSMPPGWKYHMTIEDAEHLAFSDIFRPGSVRDPRHHGWILAASTAFFRAFLEGDVPARRWLGRKQLQRDTLGEVVQEQR